MRALLLLATTATLILGPVSGALADPGYYDRGGWRPADSYGDRDPCRDAKHEAGNRGAVTGGLLGAMAGALVAGHGHKVGGAVVGGAVGAVAGNQIARSNVRCGDYPRDYRRHPDCRWVNQDGHGFEICRGRDGVWRPWSGDRDHRW
ncbi:MAG: glycine zipper 2TM domain-containing protein [Caulobacteraceae bacterium]|nr:glycine zipper 2TM domain-containing protein [Caulobacteraceae bacterium]